MSFFVVIVPPFFLFSEAFDLFEGVELFAVDPGAGCCGDVPVVFALQVGWPERPGAALVGPNWVYRTAVAGEEGAVATGMVLFDGGAFADAVEIFLAYRIDGFVEVFCEYLYLRFCDPDVSFFGARATVAALVALEMQAADVPFVFI